MRLGIDFDNTLVQYDHVFCHAARERGLISENLSPYKTHIRNSIQQEHGRDAWTQLQGYVYGKAIEQALPYERAVEALGKCKDRGISIILISHKTEWPVLGPQWNLRNAARAWLSTHGLFDETSTQNLFDEIWFEDTKDSKLQRISSQSCDLFIDDLPEFLLEDDFPKTTIPILFDPTNDHPDYQAARLASWAELPELFNTLEIR